MRTDRFGARVSLTESQMKSLPTRLRRWLFSMVFAGLTVLFIILLRMLPYSVVRVRVTDAMTIPGGLLAELYAVTFGETKHWIVTWAWLAITGNVLFYVVLWYILIGVYEVLNQRGNAGNRPS